jgi:hypothetical protein
MGHQHGPSDEKAGQPALPPTVWEKLCAHAHGVAQQIEQRFRQALTGVESREGEVEAPASWHQATNPPESAGP